MIIRSSNGSGKTLCYLIPILNSIRPGVQVVKDKIIGTKTQKNEIFMPQGVILVQTAMLMQQIEEELIKIQKQVETSGKKPEKLNFTIGRMDKEVHRYGDIILAIPKSFANRYNNKSLRLDNCKFIAIDEVDEIYEQGSDELKTILKIAEESPNLNLVVCSATMKNEFKEFFHNNSKNVVEMNLNDILKEEIGHTITLEGVSNYIKVIDGDNAKYNYILNDVFKELYSGTTKIKPKVFIFFNSVDEIEAFRKLFE
jgi:superfamily II DNA/RNA helicase